VNAVRFAQPPADLHSLAVRELASPEYRIVAPPASSQQLSWLERIASWAGKFWQYVVQSVFGRAHAGHAPAAVGDVLLVLAVLGVIFFGLRLLATITIDRRRAAASERLEDPVSAAEWYRRALATAAAGDLTNASRCTLAAAVTALAERGAIEPAAGATIGELQRALAVRAPQYARPFSTIARAFAAGVYAERPLEPVEFDRAIGAYRAIAGEA
jgi:hypothetical protein